MAPPAPSPPVLMLPAPIAPAVFSTSTSTDAAAGSDDSAGLEVAADLDTAVGVHSDARMDIDTMPQADSMLGVEAAAGRTLHAMPAVPGAPAATCYLSLPAGRSDKMGPIAAKDALNDQVSSASLPQLASTNLTFTSGSSSLHAYTILC